MHQPKPWFRASNQQWYVQLDGKQIPLADGQENEQQAWDEYHRLMTEKGKIQVPANVSFAHLADLFLDHAKLRNKPATYVWYRRYAELFADFYRGSVADLKPAHVNAWTKGWTYGSRRAGIMVVKRVMTWARKEGHTKDDPLAALASLKATRREVVISADQHEAILKDSDKAFRMFATALLETGARPGEIRKIEARHFFPEQGIWVLTPREAVKPTNRPRVIYLTRKMVLLCKKLVKRFPEGPLFRNHYGKPWTANAVRKTMRRLREKGTIPEGTICYSYRHSFATTAMTNGVNLGELRELMGHSDLRMLSEHYGHLDMNTGRMREAAEKAIRKPKPK